MLVGRRWSLCLAVCLGSVGLAGCGDDTLGGDPTGDTASSTASSGETNGTATETTETTATTATSSASATATGTASASATDATATATDATTTAPTGTSTGETGGETTVDPTGTTTGGDTTTGGITSTGDDTTTTGTTGEPPCMPEEPPMPAGDEVVIAPEFEEFYTTFELGPVPGIPPEARLGGTTIHYMDDNTLLIAGFSEAANGKIYTIGVTRGACGHIVGFDGEASVLANTPYVDANLVYVKSGLLFYTEWPVNRISQLLPGDMAPAVTTDLAGIGVTPSPGGLGFVPPSFNDPGGMRALSWAGGEWYHITRTENGELFDLSDAVQTATLPNGPGGFSYVPEGSPGFDEPHVIVAEWSVNKVGVYVADEEGDPVEETRKDFYTTFPRPWGAYFEPVTGDYLFLTWGAGVDRVYIVQGFEAPPPLPQ